MFAWWSRVTSVVYADSVIYGGALSRAMSPDLRNAETAILLRQPTPNNPALPPLAWGLQRLTWFAYTHSGDSAISMLPLEGNL